MTEQWQELKETITEMRDNNGTSTQQEVCKFLVNYMDILEKQIQDPCEDTINRQCEVGNPCLYCKYKFEPKEDNGFFDEIMNDESDGEVYEKIKEIISKAKEQEDVYNYLLHGAKSLVKDHHDLVRDIWNCSSCEHTEEECEDCYPELGYKNDKLKRDSEAVEKFVESDFFEKLMESLDNQDRSATEDTEQFLRDIKTKGQR